MALDEIDKSILRVLQRDGRRSNRDLASAVGLSAAPCLRRVQRLEEQGYISRYAALVDRSMVGRGLTVFIAVRLAQHTKSAIERFETEVLKDPAVLECHWTAGETDYLLKVAVADLRGLDQFLLERMTQIPGVATLLSNIAIRTVKDTTAVPVDQ
ncbi:MAG TPA: Lrp/AsnC family transcriptional regulator [Trebonia sp.]|jgi:Lrp/AsnC family leucine-responsive transcriptional regulator